MTSGMKTAGIRINKISFFGLSGGTVDTDTENKALGFSLLFIVHFIFVISLGKYESHPISGVIRQAREYNLICLLLHFIIACHCKRWVIMYVPLRV